jgi:phosphoribosyl-dephospho-CoA transferase
MFARHNLVWLSEQGWNAARDTLQHDCRAALDQWQRAGWPAIVRRADIGIADRQVCLGVALPPDPTDGSKTRIPLCAAVTDVIHSRPPLRISAVEAVVPPPWRAHLAALDTEATSNALPLRVYGSVALQALTGRRYLTHNSDIDLLFYPSSPAQLTAGLRLLESYASFLPLDGEIVFPSGQAVAWKEWRNATRENSRPRVLVKGTHAVSLASMESLLASLQGHSCMTS